MGAYFFDEADDDVVQATVERLDRVHRRAQHGQAFGHVFHIERPPQEIFQPTQGDVH
jgi:hypothetical protein